MADDPASKQITHREVDGVDDGGVRLALLGDIHLYRLWCAPWRMLNKRLLGQINLWFKRRHHFDRDMLPDVLRQIKAIGPDRLLLTGDVTTTGLAEEFDDVRRAFESLGDLPMIGVPGNHDRYTFSSMQNRTMEKHLPGVVPDSFPHMQRLCENWKLLLIDASVPRFLTARGRVGPVQLEAIANQLAPLCADHGVVVVCHYPLLHPKGQEEAVQHRLDDLQALREVLTQCKARMIYAHGHVHYPWCLTPPHDKISHVEDGNLEAAAFDRIIDLNVGAPCMKHRDYPDGEGFWQIDLPGDARDKILFSHHIPKRGEGSGAIDWDCQHHEV